MPDWIDNSSKLITILTNSIEGSSLSLLMQQTVQGGCDSHDACQQALVGNALRGDLLGLEDWASITAVVADPPKLSIEFTENNTVRLYSITHTTILTEHSLSNPTHAEDRMVQPHASRL